MLYGLSSCPLRNSHLHRDRDENEVAMESVLLQGAVKFREGKKWKARWCAARRLSPAADCVELHLYSEARTRKACESGARAVGAVKESLALQHFLGFESRFVLDKESNTLALLCRELVVVLAFETRERLVQWQMKLAAQLGESRQFSVLVAAERRLPAGPARLHLLDRRFALAVGNPPRLLGFWELAHLRRYGVVDGCFCFEGGALCGVNEGLHVLLADHAQDIANAFDLAATLARRIFIQTGGGTLVSRMALSNETASDTFALFKNRLHSSFHLDEKLADAGEARSANVKSDALQECVRAPATGRDSRLMRCFSCMSKLEALSPSSIAPTPSAPPPPTVTAFRPTWTMKTDRMQYVEELLPISPCRELSEGTRQTSGPYENYDMPKSIQSEKIVWITPRVTSSTSGQRSGSFARAVAKVTAPADTKEDDCRLMSCSREPMARRVGRAELARDAREPLAPVHVYAAVDAAQKSRLRTEYQRERPEPPKLMRRSRSSFPIGEAFFMSYENVSCSPSSRVCANIRDTAQVERCENSMKGACFECERAQRARATNAREKRPGTLNTLDHYLPMDSGIVYVDMHTSIDALCASRRVIIEELAQNRFCKTITFRKDFDDFEYRKRSYSMESCRFLENLEKTECADSPSCPEMTKEVCASGAVGRLAEIRTCRGVGCRSFGSNGSGWSDCSPRPCDAQARALRSPTASPSADTSAALKETNASAWAVADASNTPSATSETSDCEKKLWLSSALSSLWSSREVTSKWRRNSGSLGLRPGPESQECADAGVREANVAFSSAGTSSTSSRLRPALVGLT